MSSADTGTATPATGDTPPNTGTEATEERTSNNSHSTSGLRNSGPSNNGNAFRISNFKGKVSQVGAVIVDKTYCDVLRFCICA